MNTPGDYYAAAPAATTLPTPSRAPSSQFAGGSPASGLRRYWLVAGVLALCLIGGLGYRMLTGNDEAGSQPIELPASIDGMRLREGEMAEGWQSSMQAPLENMFGDRAFASGQYFNDRSAGVPLRGVNLIVGRGPVDVPNAMDVSQTGDRTSFGDVTCAHTVYEGKLLPTLTVCWYSTPDLGVSMMSIKAFDDMAAQAAALWDVIPALQAQ